MEETLFGASMCMCQSSRSVMSDSVTPWTATHQASLSITNSRSLLKLNVHRVGDAIQPSQPLVVPFPSRLQSFLASGSFPVRQFFSSSGQSIGVSASTSVRPVNIQDWLPLGWIGWISLQSKGLSRVFLLWNLFYPECVLMAAAFFWNNSNLCQ